MAPPKLIGYGLIGMGIMGFGTSCLMLMGMARAKAPDEAGGEKKAPFDVVALDVEEGSFEFLEELRHPGFLIAGVSRVKACIPTATDDDEVVLYHNMPKFRQNGENLECTDFCEEADAKAAENLERADLATLQGLCMVRAKESGDIEYNSNITISIVDLTERALEKEPIDYPLAFTGMAIAIIMMGSGMGYLKWWSDKFG
jgi:hypothetical protein